MKTFSQLIREAKQVNKAPTRVTEQELLALIGKMRVDAIKKHPWYKIHCLPYPKYAYKHSTDQWGEHEVEVYPYDPDVQKTDDGKIRPTKFVRFEFHKYKVTNAHVFTRPNEKSDNWIWQKSYAPDE